MSTTDELTDIAIQTREPSGIGGWLTIPAISLVFGPIMGVVNLLLTLSMLKLIAVETVTDTRLWAVILLDAAMITMTIFVACLFFARRRVAVTAIVALMLAIIAGSVIQFFLSAGVFGSDSDDVKDVIGPLVFSAVWIPYFLKSKRVKNTFVK